MIRISAVFSSVVLCCAAFGAQAQDFPVKPIRVIVPNGAGGAADIVIRSAVEEMAKQLGQSMVVENRTGAGGTIGFEAFASSKPDGYTLLGTGGNLHGISAVMYEDTLKHDPNKDIEPIIALAIVSNIVVVNPSLEVHSIKELIDLAKKQPGKLTFASAGVGTSVHMAGELFKSMTGVDMVHVPYKSSVAALVDLMAGRVDVMFDNLPSALPYIESGKLRALALTGRARSPLLPDLPTVAESGLPGYEIGNWFCLSAPAGTPKPIIAKLNAAGQTAVEAPAFVNRLSALGFEIIGGTPDKLSAMITAEVEKMHPLARALPRNAN